MTKTVDYYQQALDGELVGYKYQIEGEDLRCPVCGCEIFDERHAIVNTRFLTFLRLEWLNRGAWILDCARCGHLSWFSKEPRRLPPEKDEESSAASSDDPEEAADESHASEMMGGKNEA